MTDTPRPTTADYWFDPICPWTWITSRWLLAAAGQRGVTVTWHPYRLLIKNGDDIPEEFREGARVGLRALRVLTAVEEAAGNDAVGAFYTEVGFRIHGGDGPPDLAEALTAAGLDASLADAAGDEARDTAIRNSMEEAHRLAGSGAGSPILAVGGAERGFFGPVFTAVPDGERAGELWDHVAACAAIPELHELKRDREQGPQLPARG